MQGIIVKNAILLKIKTVNYSLILLQTIKTFSTIRAKSEYDDEYGLKK